VANSLVDPKLIETKMRTLAWMGHPYSEADFASINESVVGKTELDAVIAFLQGRTVKTEAPAEEVKP
jgi:cytochrome c oxidase cbb3-type subunit II